MILSDNSSNLIQKRVFYVRQLQVIHEDKFFHWVTSRVLHLLVATRVIKTEIKTLKWGQPIVLYWYHSFRYYRRAAQSLVELVELYSEDLVGSSVGTHGELLVTAGFAKLKFLQEALETNEFKGKKWADTGHDLDMVVARDGISYGVEVKNTLTYLPRAEFSAKLQMCKFLGIRPLFVVRMLPKTWINEVQEAGGFSLILKYLLYPEYLRPLAVRMRDELMLFVDTPKSLQEGTLRRFENWHLKQIGK